MRRLLALAALAFSLPLADTAAQSHPLAGKWTLEFVAGQRIENGAVTEIKGSATLVLDVTGDSLIGTLTSHPQPGMAQRPPVRIAGKRVDGEVSLVSTSEATLSTNGEETKVKAVSTWVLRANGDAVQGNVTRQLVGVDIPGMGAQPVTGTRAK